MALNRRMNSVKSNQNGNSLKLGFHYGLSEEWVNVPRKEMIETKENKNVSTLIGSRKKSPQTLNLTLFQH